MTHKHVPGLAMAAVAVLYFALVAVPVLGATPAPTPIPGATPAPTGSVEAYLDEGASRFDAGDLDGAIAQFSAAIALDPANEEAYLRRGNARYYKADYPGALADYSKAAQLKPGDAIAFFNLCNAQYYLKDYDGALADCDTAIRLDPSRGPVYDSRGLVRSLQGDLDGAIRDYTQAIALDANDVIAYRNRGLAYQKKHDLTSALADFDKAIQINPRYVDAYHSRATARDAAGDTSGAIADFQTVLALAPNYPDADTIRNYLNQNNLKAWLPVLSGILILALTFTVVTRSRARQRGRRPRLSFFLAAVQAAVVLLFVWGILFTLMPGGWRFQINLVPILLIAGLVLLGGGYLTLTLLPMYATRRALDQADYPRALRYARLSRWLPVPGVSTYLQGMALTAAGRYAEAIPLLRRTAARETRGTNAKDSLAWALYHAGERDEAAALFEASIAADPNGVTALSGLAELSLAHGDGAAALALLDRAAGLPESGRHGEIGANRAWALALLGRCDEARTHITSALRRLAPKVERSANQYRAAQVWRLCGDPAQALAALQEAETIDPAGIYGQRAWSELEHGQ
ncbi:MAG TPA: tetratricopeptide repeat protein [Aggregatilineales bacterium]|nr:tetratricopeptide repeat protein [Aggregatilineales bacterium]